MTQMTSLPEACSDLFAACPLAVRDDDHDGTVRSMVLMVRDGDEARFFTLTHDSDDSRYWLRRWRSGDGAEIEADQGADHAVEFPAWAESVTVPCGGCLPGLAVWAGETNAFVCHGCGWRTVADGGQR